MEGSLHLGRKKDSGTNQSPDCKEIIKKTLEFNPCLLLQIEKERARVFQMIEEPKIDHQFYDECVATSERFCIYLIKRALGATE